MKQVNKYIFQYLDESNWSYQLYDLISSVEIEFNLTFKKASELVTKELKQLGEL